MNTAPPIEDEYVKDTSSRPRISKAVRKELRSLLAAALRVRKYVEDPRVEICVHTSSSSARCYESLALSEAHREQVGVTSRYLEPVCKTAGSDMVALWDVIHGLEKLTRED